MMEPELAPVRRVEGRRLVYYRPDADSGYWSRVWRQHADPARIAPAAPPVLGELESTFLQWLPRSGIILEAGCGLGTYVHALTRHGYTVEGVDTAAETVAWVNRQRPDLAVRVGDVSALGVADGYYSGYVSLGVVEHDPAGPATILREAWRVLRPGGVAVITVPWFNPLRRLLAGLGRYSGDPRGLRFYQYAFTAPELEALLTAAGFTVVHRGSYGRYKGVKDELPWLPRCWRLPAIGPGLEWRFRGWLERENRWTTRIGHMLLLVVVKGS